MVTDYYLTTGNPNVNDILTNLNSLIAVYGNVTYDRIKNSFTFTRTYAQDSNYYNMYFKPFNNCSCFLGLKANTETLISTTGTISTFTINVNTITAINVCIDGDISFVTNNIDSCNGFYQNSDIILQKAVDVPKNGLIKYENIVII